MHNGGSVRPPEDTQSRAAEMAILGFEPVGGAGFGSAYGLGPEPGPGTETESGPGGAEWEWY
jgi:hypothetical protein